ncbi:unnamed protein product [Coregonus sp. 'balchen']|nr:unnamed protein product [Coregonus sp. 'balchen']
MTSSNESAVDIAHVYRGTFVHSTDHTAVEILEDRLLGVDMEGKIAFIGSGQEVDSLSQKWRFEALAVTQLGQHEFFMPGMVDTHIHASQYSYAGTALDLPLLQWLNTYTFPVEARYKDMGFARNVYTHVVKRTLRNGTTTACYFATIHTDAALLLGQIANDFGQRALVGKVCMDTNNFVPHYKETAEESQDETNRFIGELLKNKYPLVRPVVTPRFAPSCSSALLGHLGEIAQNNNLHIQSHISETKEEVKLVKELFPDYDSYTDVYHKHNLLTDKVVQWYARCPQGSEPQNVAGGYSPSMLDAVRRTLDTSKALTIQDPQYQTLTFEEVFRLATLGGSQALSLDAHTGNFKVGKDFDALRVLLEKFLNLGDDRNIAEVYVAGKRVVPFVERP